MPSTHFFHDWYSRNRARSRALFDLVSEEAYYSRPIDLRHPIVFYEGHLPGFSFNTLVKRALGGPSIDARLESLFARGIDPHEEQAGRTNGQTWPARREVQQFADEADRRVQQALIAGDLDRPGDPLLDRSEAVFTILEHEAMHQETLLYMWHRLPFDQKRKPHDYRPIVDGAVPRPAWIDVPAGRATLGADTTALEFGWDNERPARVEAVEAFSMQQHDVTNAAFLEFVDAGGYENARWWAPDDWAWVQKAGLQSPIFWERVDGAWQWRGMFEWIPLPLAWPVYVSHAEASAYAAWRGLQLPTEAQFQRAAYGTHDGMERTHPWGSVSPSPEYGVFDFTGWDPEPAGSHPAGRSAWGIDDLVGNGWEWTRSVFAPFPGFRPLPSYPEYSADFFDGEHVVMKGASPATARELLRPTFRNWFRPRYPYVYATFRCVRMSGG
ncbi:MAG TPA: SUMF1/EgtB/PvdO family nonheme iron enzyme [Vicinamibacterales bacterium]